MERRARGCIYPELNSFLSVQGPELMNKYVGESERAVREVRRVSVLRSTRSHVSVWFWTTDFELAKSKFQWCISSLGR